MEENQKPIPEVQGFNLSQDYDLLWKLINNGYRVPAWVRYANSRTEPDDDPWYDIVEVKKRDGYGIDDNNCYSIGTRGIGYDWGFNQEGKTIVETFSDNCKKNNLWFATPNYKVPLVG